MVSITRATTTALVALMLSGCVVARPTRVTTTWRDPAVAAPLRLQKVAAVFPEGDAKLRRRVEDALVQRLPRTTASYRLINRQQLADTQHVRDRLIDRGFDGIVVLRLIDVEERRANGATSTAASPADGLWSYMRRAPRSAPRPGRETAITMESRLYSVGDGRLLWAGHSTSYDPVSMRELVGVVADAAIVEVRRQGLF